MSGISLQHIQKRQTAVHVIADCEWPPAYSIKREWHGPIWSTTGCS